MGAPPARTSSSPILLLRAADCSTAGVLYFGPTRVLRAGLLPFPPRLLREMPAAVSLPVHRSDQAGHPGDRGVHGQPRPRGPGAALPRPADVEASRPRRDGRSLPRALVRGVLL